MILPLLLDSLATDQLPNINFIVAQNNPFWDHLIARKNNIPVFSLAWLSLVQLGPA